MPVALQPTASPTLSPSTMPSVDRREQQTQELSPRQPTKLSSICSVVSTTSATSATSATCTLAPASPMPVASARMTTAVGKTTSTNTDMSSSAINTFLDNLLLNSSATLASRTRSHHPSKQQPHTSRCLQVVVDNAKSNSDVRRKWRISASHDDDDTRSIGSRWSDSSCCVTSESMVIPRRAVSSLIATNAASPASVTRTTQSLPCPPPLIPMSPSARSTTDKAPDTECRDIPLAVPIRFLSDNETDDHSLPDAPQLHVSSNPALSSALMKTVEKLSVRAALAMSRPCATQGSRMETLGVIEEAIELLPSRGAVTDVFGTRSRSTVLEHPAESAADARALSDAMLAAIDRLSVRAALTLTNFDTVHSSSESTGTAGE